MEGFRGIPYYTAFGIENLTILTQPSDTGRYCPRRIPDFQNDILKNADCYSLFDSFFNPNIFLFFFMQGFI